MQYKVGDEVRVIELQENDEIFYEMGETFIVYDAYYSFNELLVKKKDCMRALYVTQVELVKEEVKMKKKTYNRMEMFVELKKENSKVFRNEMGTEFYVNSEGELKGRTTVGRIYSPELMFRTETEYYEVPKPYVERIKNGDFYYYVDIANRYGNIGVNSFDGNKEDLYFIETNNFFETSGEAQEKLNKIAKVLKGDK